MSFNLNKMSIQNSLTQIPNIWKTFERTSKEGYVNKFWIQILPDEHIEIAINYLAEYFLREEPSCKAANVRDSEAAIEDMRTLWRYVINQKCTLACFTKDDNNEHKLVALNLCFKSSLSAGEIDYPMTTEKIKKLISFYKYISNFKNLYEMFNVDEYLGSVSLLTLAEYRGYNIGLELLESRKCLCQALGLKLSVSIFTGPASQRLAEKAGFQDVFPISIDRIEKENPDLIIPNLRNFTKKLRIMYISYDM